MIRVEYLGLAFAGSEFALAFMRRAGRTGGVSHDAGTLSLVWVVIGASITAAVAIARTTVFGRFAAADWMPAALAVLGLGLALRWWAILVLGRLFTVDVAIRDDHRLVTRGPYRLVRHPSYTGLLIAFAGLGLTLGSWPALAALCLPIAAAFVRRIRVEERALSEHFGPEWDAYRARTWRLVPFAW